VGTGLRLPVSGPIPNDAPSGAALLDPGSEPETVTLQFENARSVQALYAGDPGLLKTLEDALKVHVTTREGWLKIEGPSVAVADAKTVFEQLDRARQQGVPIRRFEFNYALKSVTEPNGDRRGLGSLSQVKIQTSARKPPVLAKTANQLEYVRQIETRDVVFGLGPAGTGKTFLAVAMAVAALRREQVGRIILTRPAVEAGEALGFLPGDLQEKIFPYLRPLYDALNRLVETEELQRYLDRKMIEIAPLAYMRGRTLDEAFIILDEAQNTTTEQMFMFLTRLGTGAKCVVTGDRTQIDLPPNRRSGLVEAIQALKDVPGISFCQFEECDVVRHELVQSIIRAYRLHRYGEPANPVALPAGLERGAGGI
jgi:phosphate starvation-inducible PhoH-like protein